jgi:tetratricopeptide (TPR) repeat protein
MCDVRNPRRPSTRLVTGLAVVATVGFATPALADRVSDAHRKLGELEQRAQLLSSSFRESYAPDPNAADRRVLEAETLYTLKNYNAAATLCLDVIERYPQSRAYDDALFLLADSLFKDGDLLSARRYFSESVKKNAGTRREQTALQRLVEISLRTGDYDNVDSYLSRLEAIPAGSQEPSGPYVRGKYFFFRNRLDEALRVFQSISPGHPYYLHSRYFLATVQVKRGDPGAAMVAFDEVLKLQAKDAGEREIQDLARLAIGRLLYDKGQFDRAKEWYASVPRQSKHFTDAMFESAWNSIKSKDYKSAYRALDLMLLQDPEGAQAPENKLLIGKLHLRLSNFYLASNTFTQTLEEYEPLYREMTTRLQRAKADPKFFDSLVEKGLDKFDVTAVFPKPAIKLVVKEPDVARMLTLAEELGSLQKGIKDSEDLLVRLEKAISGPNKVSIYPDLSSARTRSTEILNQTIDVRRRFQADARGLAAAFLSPQDRAALEQIAGERGVLDQELKNLPLTQESMRRRVEEIKRLFGGLDAQASEINVVMQSMSAELTAIEQYFLHSRNQQKIKQQELDQPVESLRQEITMSQEALDKLRNEITEASQDAAMAGEAAAGERQATVRLAELLKREQEILARARNSMSPENRLQFDGLMSILERADGLQGRLVEFDGRLDGIAEGRLKDIRGLLVTEKGNLQVVSGKLGSVMTEGQSVGGTLAEAMMSKATDRFYDLTVQSDVGLVDVSWGIKDSKTQAVSKLINQQKQEIQAVDDDFVPLLRED